MTVLIRILSAVLVLELVLCTTLLVKRNSRHVAIIPDVTYDDPLLENELKTLAAATESAKSSEWHAYADALLGRGFYGEAEHAYRRAHELDPANHMAQFGLAFCLDRTGRTEESTAEYLKAAKIETKSSSLIGSKQHALYQAGKNSLREENVASAKKLFVQNKEFASAKYQLAKLLLREGNFKEAMLIIESVLAKAPNSLKFNSLLLHAMEESGQPQKANQAARMLERSQYFIPADMNTNYVQPFSEQTGINKRLAAYNRLIGYANMDKLAKNLESIWQLIENSNMYQKQMVLLSMVEVEYQRKNPDAILQVVSQTKKLGISSPDMLQMEGAAYALKGEQERAVELWERAIQMSPNIPLHQMLSNHYKQQGDQASRKHHAAQAALLTTKMYYWNNDLATAREAAKLTLKLDPELQRAWFYLGEIENGLGNPEEAADAYQKCLELNPNHGRAAQSLADLGVKLSS